MTLYRIYDAWTDTANDSGEEVRARGNHAEMVEDVKGYADGAFNIVLSADDAERIVNAYERYTAAMNGKLEGYDYHEYSFNFDKLVKFPLEEIEVEG